MSYDGQYDALSAQPPESRGYIKGIEQALFILDQSEGDIDFLKFRLERHLKEFREGDGSV